MLSPIHSLISDLKLERDLLRELKTRRIEQKHRYTEQGAQLYYSSYNPYVYKESFFGRGVLSENYLFFLKNFILSKDKKQNTAFVLLGCGKTSEKTFLEKIHDEGYKFTLFGVDSSHAMLELANDNLKDVGFDKKFICADFTEDTFITEIERIVGQYDQRVFAFLGGTFSVFIPTDIVDTLANLVHGKDLLWVEVLLREGTDEKNDLLLFKHFAKRLDDKSKIRNDLYPLEKMGIPFDSGEMTLETVKEPSVGAINFKYIFVMKKKTNIFFRNERITLLPDEKIDLLNIRAYSPEKLVSFFQDHGFQLIEMSKKDNRGLFLFRL